MGVSASIRESLMAIVITNNILNQFFIFLFYRQAP
jgi:hypothetical protein